VCAGTHLLQLDTRGLRVNLGDEEAPRTAIASRLDHVHQALGRSQEVSLAAEEIKVDLERQFDLDASSMKLKPIQDLYTRCVRAHTSTRACTHSSPQEDVLQTAAFERDRWSRRV
jgi:hypothetical protein